MSQTTQRLAERIVAAMPAQQGPVTVGSLAGWQGPYLLVTVAGSDVPVAIWTATFDAWLAGRETPTGLVLVTFYDRQPVVIDRLVTRG